ncbi:MAG: class I SAM-dependent methyltransferase [Candidatus Lindowbacteria bacterium]|nr:class I SAM-dependent methyltransferase [Candidatus Lindowbacteria bacterium]
MIQSTTLHLGCGNKKVVGALGIDFNPKSQADLIHDLSVFPWPLESDTFDRVICAHVLEHLDDIVRVMAELHRVCKDGAIIEIRTPHFSNVHSWDDPTHRYHFTTASFDYFQKGHSFSYCDVDFEISERKLTFGGSIINIPARLLCAISLRFYEKHCAFMMPAHNLMITLRAWKRKV